MPQKYDTASHWNEVLRGEFEKESDRAAVILTVSIFEDALYRMLKNYLVASTSSTDELLDGANAPFSTFSAKITASHRLGLVSSKFCRDLHIIRRIRNEFAHNIHGCTFDNSAVRSRVLEIVKSSGIIERNPKTRATFPDGLRGDFLMCASWMLYCLNQEIEEISPLDEARKEWGYDKRHVEEADE